MKLTLVIAGEDERLVGHTTLPSPSGVLVLRAYSQSEAPRKVEIQVYIEAVRFAHVGAPLVSIATGVVPALSTEAPDEQRLY